MIGREVALGRGLGRCGQIADFESESDDVGVVGGLGEGIADTP